MYERCLRVLKGSKRILVECHCEIFIILAFFYLSVHVLYYAYYRSVYISPDSADYLLEAEAILDGYGFNMNGIAGHDGWFSSWPIGYPFLIASISFVTGWNVYLSSKVLSILIVAAERAYFVNDYAYPLNTIGKQKAMEKILCWAKEKGVIGLGRVAAS